MGEGGEAQSTLHTYTYTCTQRHATHVLVNVQRHPQDLEAFLISCKDRVRTDMGARHHAVAVQVELCDACCYGG